MGVPFTFTPTTVAYAANMNANFDYLEGVVGEDSVAGTSIRPRGVVRFGPSQTAQISHITAASVLFGNNYAEQADGGGRKLIRLAGAKGLALDLDRTEGFKFRTSFYATGDLSSMTEIPMHIGLDARYIAVPNGWHFQNKKGAATSLSDYRLTYVALQEPILIYQGIRIDNPKETERSVYSWGIPREAIMVRVQLVIQSEATTTAEFYVVKSDRTRNVSTGMGVIANKGKGIAEGDVVLGQGGYGGKIVDYTYGSIVNATFTIKGYWV